MVGNLISLDFFHGSPIAGLTKLDERFSDPGWPFGPGIYLTAELDVARSYASSDGVIYSVTVAGEKCGVINLDRNWGDQSHLAVAVGARLFKEFGIARPDVLWEANARVVLDVVKDKSARNDFLAKQGIWLLSGHLDSTEGGGLGDRGCQFLLLDASRVKKLTAL